jgi:hypothetical protein
MVPALRQGIVLLVRCLRRSINVKRREAQALGHMAHLVRVSR